MASWNAEEQRRWLSECPGPMEAQTDHQQQPFWSDYRDDMV
jgi:hypothetical protein